MLKNKFLLVLLMLAMAAVIAACGGGGDSGGSGSDSGGGGETTSGDADAGAAVFENNCMSCHGAEGEGASAPSLQESDVASNHDEVVDIVTNGTDGGMPAFEGQLSEQEINDVSAYVSEQIAN